MNLTKVAKPREICIVNPKLRRIRTVCRLILRAAVKQRLEELDKAYNESEVYVLENPSEGLLKLRRLRKEISYLAFSLVKYPLGCALCGESAVGENLIYNPFDSSWYCRECYTFNQSYYKKNTTPCGLNWKTMYP